MADQLAAQSLPVYGHKVVKAPHIAALADRGVTFDSAYCNNPICAPSRFSMLSGQLSSRIGAYDNAAEFPASIPTYVHHLRHMDYHTCLAGKMHFVGPDQLHGFEERITQDIYPTSFGWTALWDLEEGGGPGNFADWPNLDTVTEAGVFERSLEMDFDDEVLFQAKRRLYDYARDDKEQPFFLTVSFIQPHDPYCTSQRLWDRYDHDEIDLPPVPAMAPDDMDPHSRRLYYASGADKSAITDEHVRNARHAYYGMVSDVDDHIGELMDVLKETGQLDNTIIILTADHGDMLGERGMWFKMTFYERSVRVPLIIAGPGMPAGKRVGENVSLLDIFPTFVELAGDGMAETPVDPIDGHSLTGLLTGHNPAWDDTVYGEYTGDGAIAPCFMVRRGDYKYIHCDKDPAQLFSLNDDPLELNNLIGRSEVATIEQAFAADVANKWNSAQITQDALASQRRRVFVDRALSKGVVPSWQHNVHQKPEASRYMGDYDPWFDTEQRALLRPKKGD